MATNYSGGSSFWSDITNVIDTELVTHAILYKGGLNKLFDRGRWLLDEIVRRFARLASTSSSLPAITTGSVDLSGLNYDATTGDLNGLTLILESDTNGPTTVTFGTGGSAPTSPADVVSQINTATASDPVAALTSGSLLTISSVTVGGSGTVEVGASTSTATLGLTVGIATGTTTGGDGASQIGCPAQGALVAGTLKAQLLALDGRVTLALPIARAIYGQVVADGAGNVSITAGSSGNFTAAISGSGVRITFTVARANAGYSVTHTEVATAGTDKWPLVGNKATTHCDLFLATGAASIYNLATNPRTLNFILLGS